MNIMSRGVKYSAILMIYLIISIIFISADALAVFTFNVTGSEGIKGFRAADDSAEIKIISDFNVSIVDINNASSMMFCVNATNSSLKHCEWSDAWGATNGNLFKFTLRHHSSPTVDYAAYLMVDRIAPEFTAFNVTKVSSGIMVNYSLRDYAYSKSLSNCSGISRIDYEIDGISPGSISFNTTVGKCIIDSGFIAAVQPGYYPNFRVALRAYDKIGNQNINSTMLKLDFQAPVIQDDFDIVSSGNPITTVSSQADTAGDIVVRIDDANLDTSRVYGDLRRLHDNNVISQGYRNRTASCIPETVDNLTYMCVFSGLKIRPSNDTLKINITSFDKDHNHASKVLSKTITLLDDPGQPLFIGPDKSQCLNDLSICHTHPGNNIFIIELSSLSNYSKSRINMGIDTATTFSLCSYEDKWICKTPYNIPQNTNIVRLYIAYGSVDDYGNKVPIIKRDILIDNDPPLNITGMVSDTPSCALDGTLNLAVNVKESKSPVVNIWANTSEFTLKDKHEGTCTKTVNDDWECKLSITSFKSEYKNIPGFVVVQDLAGNKLMIPYTFEVCASDNQVTPSVINSIKSRDITIDRRTASYIGVKNYVPLQITLSRTDASILGLTLENCIAMTTAGQDVIGSERGYFLTSTGTRPIAVVYVGYNGALLPQDPLYINCTLSARVRIKDTLYANPERKAFYIKAQTYNNPLGIVDDASASEIQVQKAHLRDLDGTIEKYQSWEDTLGSFCKIAEYVGKLNSVVQGVKAALYPILLALSAWGVTAPIAELVWSAVQKVAGGFHSVATYIWPPGLLPVSVGMVVKYVCMIYTCKHLDFGTYLQAGVDLTSSGALNLLGTDDGVRFAGEKSLSFELKGTPLSAGLYKDFQDNVFIRNEQLINGMNQHQWVLNPYKSVHWDNTCAPAILYNSKKEKQLRCKYVSCLENAVSLGLPKAVCDSEHSYNTCLYLDSAEWVVAGQSTTDAFFKGLFDAVMNNLLGIGATIVYMITCWNYYIPGGYLKDIELYSGGWSSAFCGVAGAYLGAKEVYEFFSNPINEFASDNPIGADKDYCTNVDYTEGG